ncbi:MAG: dihydrolipoamide acetyltransferase family protein [Acidithiobacillus sp.]|nr:dihydrolipoamide acetyltransferase family protein [Acidithiobacillus sp.]
MKEPILMPVLSDTMQTGRLTRWNKSVGDPVHKGDALAEVETDKAVMDVEAFADGYLAGPLAPVDQDIPVRQTIGYLVDSPALTKAQPSAADDGKETTEISQPPSTNGAGSNASPLAKESKDHSGAASPAPPAASVVPTSEVTPSAVSAPSEGADLSGSSPYARALAADLGIDISHVPAGPDGKIHASQVIAAAVQPQDADLRLGPPFLIRKPSSLRAAVARNMVASLSIPSFQISADFALQPLQARSKAQKRSFTLALARACALTVAEDPYFNTVWTAKGLAVRSRVDIGIAVDTGAGLITPVLRDAAERPTAELAEDWRILLDKVKTGRLVPEDYQGASFYVSNLGIFPEITQFDAIVPVGASAILAVSAPSDNGKTVLTLSCDHRVIFGADAARFLQRLGQRLQDPSWLS